MNIGDKVTVNGVTYQAAPQTSVCEGCVARNSTLCYKFPACNEEGLIFIKSEPSKMTLEQAEIEAKKCEYAILATEIEGNEINWADASMFFMEGYNQAVKEFNRKSETIAGRCGNKRQ